MTIHVTQDDIDAGKRGSCSFCPIAIAMRRYVRRGEWPWVTTAHYYCGIGNAGDTPDIATKFIRHFDRTGKGKPFSFDV